MGSPPALRRTSPSGGPRAVLVPSLDLVRCSAGPVGIRPGGGLRRTDQPANRAAVSFPSVRPAVTQLTICREFASSPADAPIEPGGTDDAHHRPGPVPPWMTVDNK